MLFARGALTWRIFIIVQRKVDLDAPYEGLQYVRIASTASTEIRGGRCRR